MPSSSIQPRTIAWYVFSILGFVGALVAVVIGTIWGSISGYLGGVVDSVMMRIIGTGIMFRSDPKGRDRDCRAAD